MGRKRTCWQSVPSKPGIHHSVDPSPKVSVHLSTLVLICGSSDPRVRDFEGLLNLSDGVLCAPPNQHLCSANAKEIEPGLPDVVNEGNTEIASLQPREAEIIRLNVKYQFG